MLGSTQVSEVCIKKIKSRASDILSFLNSEAGEKGRVDWSGVKVCGYMFTVRISNNSNVLNLQKKTPKQIKKTGRI